MDFHGIGHRECCEGHAPGPGPAGHHAGQTKDNARGYLIESPVGEIPRRIGVPQRIVLDVAVAIVVLKICDELDVGIGR